MLGCAVVLAAAVLRIAVHDPTDEPVSGDQASFTYQALSLLGGDLAYDASDQRRWLDLGWADQPHGLFVQQREDGWAFAKPLGYSVLLAPAIGLFGGHGISLVGAALVLAYAACWYGIGRLRWDRAGAAAVATAATVASHAWLFGFPAHADLFVAVLVGAAALGAARVAGVGQTTPPQPFWGQQLAHMTDSRPQNDGVCGAPAPAKTTPPQPFWGQQLAHMTDSRPQNDGVCGAPGTRPCGG